MKRSFPGAAVFFIALLCLPFIAHAATGTKTQSLAQIQNPVAQAMVRQYLDVLADDPALQQKVMGCAIDQINQSPEVQDLLGAHADKLQKAIQTKSIDLKKMLLTIKQVFDPCLQIMNSNLKIQ